MLTEVGELLLELKNAADEKDTVWTACQQLQTYQNEIPPLFQQNAALVVSDGVRPGSGRSRLARN